MVYIDAGGHHDQRISPLLCLTLLLSLFLLSTTSYAETESELSKIREGFVPTEEEKAAGAVVLKRELEIKVDSKGLESSSEHVVVAILDDQAAADYGRIQASFNDFYTEANLDFARLVDVDGRLHQAEPDAVQIRARQSENTFDDIKILAFSLPGVRPGSILEYRIEYRDRRPLMEGHWFHRVWISPFQYREGRIRIDLQREFNLALDLPADTPLQHYLSHLDQPFTREEQEGRDRYLWQFLQMPQIQIESSMGILADKVPVLHLSSIPNWETIDDWGSKIYLEASRPVQEIEAALEAMTEPTQERGKMLRQIYRYMDKNIRYVEADFKRGGIIPHKAAKVLTNGYGDCKDQATLFVALLRAAGIEAYTALVGFFPEPHVVPRVPSLHFSHMIVYVPMEEEGLWLDTSGLSGQYPGVDWSLEGRLAFVIDGKGGRLKTIPRRPPEENSIALDLRYTNRDDGLALNVGTRMKGAFNHRFKSIYRHNPDYKQELAKLFQSMFPSGKLLAHDVRGVGEPGDFSATATLLFESPWDDNQSVLKFGGALQRAVTTFTSLTQLDQPVDRDHDYDFGLAYQLKVRAEVIRPGEEYYPIPLAGEDHVKTDYFEYRLKSGVTPANGFESEMVFTLKKRAVPAKHYARFYRDIHTLLNRANWGVLYKRDADYETKLALDGSVAEKNPTELIKLARLHLSHAAYEEAKKVAEAAVKAAPVNGEAHYILGMALGFLDAFDESDKAFSKAKSLGYRP